MDIRFGMPVVSSDGTELGHVNRFIIEPDTNEIYGIVVHSGTIFGQDRVVELGFVDDTQQGDVVHLRLNTQESKQLREFVEHEYVVPTPEQLRDMPYPLESGVSGGGAGVMPMMWRSTYTGQGFRPASRSLLESASVDATTIRHISNIPDDALLVDKGTDVIALDGKKVGRVDDILYGDDGTISGFVVKAGVFRHHDIQVEMDMVEAITADHIRLRVDADEIAELPTTVNTSSTTSRDA